MHVWEWLSGLGQWDVALLLVRLVTGSFFFLYRFRWIYDPSQPQGDRWFSQARKKRLIERLCSCGYTSNPALAALVAISEILAGLALIAGFLTIPAAFAILVTMVFANCCTPREEIPLMHPVDCVDKVACYLRLVEPLYLTNALVLILCGPGLYSVDAWLRF